MSHLDTQSFLLCPFKASLKAHTTNHDKSKRDLKLTLEKTRKLF